MRQYENRADRFSKLKSDRTYPMSNTKASRDIIRQHMLDYYSNYDEYDGAKNPLDAMIMDADAGNGGMGRNHPYPVGDWQKGKYLAEAANFAVYDKDVKDLLKQIYVPEDVDKWDVGKAFDRYANLIGREYARMVADYKKGKK